MQRSLALVASILATSILAGCGDKEGGDGYAAPAGNEPKTFDFTVAEPYADRLNPGDLLLGAATSAVPEASEYAVRLADVSFAPDGLLEAFIVSYETRLGSSDVTVIDYRPHAGEPAPGVFRAWIDESSSDDFQGPRLWLRDDAVTRLGRHSFNALFDTLAGELAQPMTFSLFPGVRLENATDGQPLLVASEAGVTQAEGLFSISHDPENGSVVGQIRVGNATSLVRFD